MSVRGTTPTPRHGPESRIRLEWAVEAGQPVHIGRFSHLRGCYDRPTLGCLGCNVPLMPVLPCQSTGVAGRVDHFRHVKSSPKCTATAPMAAMVWNVACHLHASLALLIPSERHLLRFRAYCSSNTSPYTRSLNLFSSHCEHFEERQVPAWDDLRIERHEFSDRPECTIKLLKMHAVLFEICISHRPITSPRTGSNTEWLGLEVGGHNYSELISWSPQSWIPATSAQPAVRCEHHRGGSS